MAGPRGKRIAIKLQSIKGTHTLTPAYGDQRKNFKNNGKKKKNLQYTYLLSRKEKLTSGKKQNYTTQKLHLSLSMISMQTPLGFGAQI